MHVTLNETAPMLQKKSVINLHNSLVLLLIPYLLYHFVCLSRYVGQD